MERQAVFLPWSFHATSHTHVVYVVVPLVGRVAFSLLRQCVIQGWVAWVWWVAVSLRKFLLRPSMSLEGFLFQLSGRVSFSCGRHSDGIASDAPSKQHWL